MERFEEALECFSKALELDPEDVFSWINKGSSLALLERFDEALECFDKAIELDPENELALKSREAAINRLENRK